MLKPYEVVGDVTKTPYKELDKVIWEGLGFVDFAFMPHWDSDHPETKAIDRGIKYEALRDGEVLIF
jgi:dipeptidase E